MRIAGTVLWREIEEALRQDIAEGVFPAGSRLPVEADLAGRFGVNRHTIRRALAALQERGAISIEHGRGTFVKAPKLAYPVGQRTRYTENVARLSLSLKGRLLRSRDVCASSQVARDLQIRKGSKCIVMDDLREIDGEPVSLTTRYFPAKRFPGIVDVFEELRSVTESFRHFGIEDYTRLRTRVHARGATLEEAAALKIPNGAPTLVVEAVNVDAAGIPIEYGCARSAGGRFELIFEPGS